jgi:PAS domain-containing protein
MFALLSCKIERISSDTPCCFTIPIGSGIFMSSSIKNKPSLLRKESKSRPICQLGFVLALTLLFVIVYQPLHAWMGNGVTMLSMLPVLLFGLFFGLRAGIFSAFIFSLLDIFLIGYYQIATLGEIFKSGIIFGAIALVILGALIGYMSDLRKTLTAELSTKRSIENELETQRKRVVEILNEQQDIVCRFTPDFRITYLNPVGQKFFLDQSNALVGTNLLTLFSEQESRFIRRFFDRPEVKSKPVKFEFPLLDLNQEKLFFQWVATE